MHLDIFKIWIYIRENWHNFGSCLFLCIIVCVCLLLINKTYYIPISCLIIFVFWSFTTWPRRCSIKEFGVIFAINPEKTEDNIVLISDFSNQIEELASKHNIMFWKLEHYESQKIINHNSAIEACKRHNSQMVIWGQFKIRKINGEEKRIIELHVSLYNEKIDNKVLEELDGRFHLFLPKTIVINNNNEYIGLKILSSQIESTSSYLVAVSLYLTQKYTESLEILMSLKHDFENTSQKLNRRNFLYFSIVEQLMQNFFALTCKSYLCWFNDNNINSLDNVDNLLNEMYNENLMDDFYHNMRAIIIFLKFRDVDRAIKELIQIRNKQNHSLLFNLGFLLSYKDEIDKAWIKYNKLSKIKKIKQEVILEVIEFIKRLNEFENNGMNFALGIVYFKIAKQQENGIKYLSDYLLNANTTKNPISTQNVERLLESTHK